MTKWFDFLTAGVKIAPTQERSDVINTNPSLGTAMDQTVFNIVVGVASAAAGWIMRILWEAQRDLRIDMAALQKTLPETYLRRDDWRDSMMRIENMLDKIFDRIEGKADK